MSRKKFDPSLLPPSPDLSFERELWDSGLKLVAGIDEAGRGALAGPVVAGVVILPDQPDLMKTLDGVHDSKQMTAKAREKWAEVICQTAILSAVGFASAAEVDQLGIISATRQAVLRALDSLEEQPEHLLIDHLSVPAANLLETVLTKGDCRSLSIAAASVLAKVNRDTVMVALDADFPVYGFASHKGYGTARHRMAIEQHGPCPEHRMSFAPLRQEEDNQLKLL